jgi:hypothetical protein
MCFIGNYAMCQSVATTRGDTCIAANSAQIVITVLALSRLSIAVPFLKGNIKRERLAWVDRTIVINPHP